MINDPDFQKNLLISVVTSIIVLVLVDPILKFSANTLMWLGANVSDAWTNGIYLSAALGLREKFSFFVFAFSAAVFSGLVAGTTAARIGDKKETILKAAASPSASREPSGADGAKVAAPSRSIIRVTRLAAEVLFAVGFLLSTLSLLASNFAELQLVASFNQRLAVLNAKATDQQVKNLRASWALMTNRKDYEAINSAMLQIAGQNGLRLPPPLWE